MHIKVKDKSCVYVYDQDYDDVWFADDYESVHLHFRCRHDWIEYDRDTKDMWCPDCKNEHLTTNERLEYLRALWEEGDLDDDT